MAADSLGKLPWPHGSCLAAEGEGRDSFKKEPPSRGAPAPPAGEPGAPDRLEPGEEGEDDVALVVVPQVEQVAGQGGPQVDAGDPGQQGVLEAGSEVRVVCVQGQVGVLGAEGTIQCSGCLLQNCALPPGPKGHSMCTGSEGCEDERVGVQTSVCCPKCELPQEVLVAPFPRVLSLSTAV